jgi:hypothetical protein
MWLTFSNWWHFCAGEDDRGDQNEGQEPASKKKKLGDWMASNVADINDDELEVYGNQQATNVEITSYAFEVSAHFNFQVSFMYISMYVFTVIVQ